ncbi:hypothetical protein JL37_11125 [Achromobacter sp. RTa]|uniref:DUF1799 domain-containing protein n=1 Tax=Achromobacter sp. RTa TaxID=1532557 RepID=UPI00050E13A7|nr:DUF1799 domain-containing protein [Achromobacter sp. RTa]KGD95238.1 hypothetical protein JL37_11125 [Achromobacter sp. RTa]
MLAALRAAGASPEVIEAARPAGESQAQAFEIWPENWATFEAFLALGRCWTWVAPAMGDPVRVGIASAEIEATLRLLQVKRRARREMFMELRAMEQAAIEVFENKG